MNEKTEKTAYSAPCPYAKKCGACNMQNLPYEDQLRIKQSGIIRLLGRYSRVERIIGMKDPTHYRNKVQAAFRQKSGKVVSGVYQAGSHHIIEVEDCMLEDPCAAPILATIRKLAASMKIKPYDMVTGQGYLRHVLIRRGFQSGEIMVVIVTTPGEFRNEAAFVNELCRRHPEITTVVHNINPTDTPLFLGGESHTLYGDGVITDRLCGLTFRISPRSFYQVNPTQTEILYKKARDLAALTGRERVIDAYCGTGTIGLSMASSARELKGIEIVEGAVLCARENAAANGIQNAEFICGDAGDPETILRVCGGRRPDVVVIDPPRKGSTRELVNALAELGVPGITYVSCDPDTLARDCVWFKEAGYTIGEVQPVDMFPRTGHVESVVRLSKHL